IPKYNQISFKSKANQNISNPNDSFVKQENSVSFSGFRKRNKQVTARKEKDLSSSLKDLKIKGSPFLLGLATSIAMVKMGEDADELLFDDNGYLVTDKGVQSDLVTIDDEKGIIKFEGTGIEINADDYDIVDWENGIFRNYDGSVDIDLGNNKFIDTQSGIFVDPAAKISAVLDGASLQCIAVPSFTSGHDLFPWDGNDDVPSKPKSAKIMEEERQTYQRYLKSLIKAKDSENLPQNDDIKDIFGNPIIAATDKDGDRYLASYSPEIDDNSVFAPFKKILGSETVAETVNNARLKSYIDENYPSFGTRIQVYEGGRNATHTLPLEEYEKFDDSAYEVRDKIINEAYRPEPGSEEAINFAKYQNRMIRLHCWKEPLLSPNELLDIDGDGIADIDIDGDGIPDYDMDGDGIIDMSSEQDRGIIGELIYTLRRFFN
ncbi:MAG: hypothetical protein LUG16_02010, partial [Candidatus Gastranaerophilales bacterium]|nr:hypothetical protein [Candidatus Gastranaerophilales bacterium]